MHNFSQNITIRRPDDWHLHLRDGQALYAVLPDSVRQFRRALIMPNLKPPVTTTTQALTYRNFIIQCLQEKGLETRFEPLMSLYLTDHTPPSEIDAAVHSGHIYAVKLYPAGATTNSAAGVTDLKHCYPVLERMQTLGLPLLMHGEVTDPSVDLFDREAVFIDRVLIPLRHDFPALKIVFEHLTTAQGVDYVRQAQGPIGATLTAHHLLYNRNAIFTGGVRPDYYCLPVLKRETHRQALLAAATSGNPRFFLGTDSAPHASAMKWTACGCAGCYTGLHALPLYATAFESVGRLDQLENFASVFGAQFYGLEPNTETITLVRQPYTIPTNLPYANGSQLTPLAAGETLNWTIQDE